MVLLSVPVASTFEVLQALRAARNTHCPLAQRDYWWMRLLIETGARIDEFAHWSAAQAEQEKFLAQNRTRCAQ